MQQKKAMFFSLWFWVILIFCNIYCCISIIHIHHLPKLNTQTCIYVCTSACQWNPSAWHTVTNKYLIILTLNVFLFLKNISCLYVGTGTQSSRICWELLPMWVIWQLPHTEEMTNTKYSEHEKECVGKNVQSEKTLQRVFLNSFWEFLLCGTDVDHVNQVSGSDLGKWVREWGVRPMEKNQSTGCICKLLLCHFACWRFIYNAGN